MAIGRDMQSASLDQMRLGSRVRDAPLGSHTRIRQAAEEVLKRLPITGEGWAFVGCCGLEHRSKLGQFGVGKPGMPVMHAMKRLVKQSEGHELPKPSPCYNASCRTVYGRAG